MIICSDSIFQATKMLCTEKCLYFLLCLLKELIQNAEDAGATEVKFMYDETEYGVESLWSPDMTQHQGELLQ